MTEPTEPYVAQCHANGYSREHLNVGSEPEYVRKRREQLRKPVVVEPEPELIDVHTSAPIPLMTLKRKFTEKINFIVDYDQSRHKGKVFLTYLSNMDIKVQVESSDVEAMKALLVDYLTVPVLVSCELLEDLAMNVLLAHARKPHTLPFEAAPFIEANKGIIEIWYRRLLSLNLFGLWCIERHKDFVRSHTHDDNDSVEGINFVSLIKHRLFVVLMAHHDPAALTWNKRLFDEYIFAGSNLFSFFAIEENPLFAMILAVEDPVDHHEFVLQLKTSFDNARTLAEI